MALALLAAFGPSQAQTAPAEAPAAPESSATPDAAPAEASVSIGLGVLSGNDADRALFGQYNGLRSGSNAVGLLGLEYSRRNAAGGRTFDLQGTNLLLDSRELRLVWKRPGHWSFGADYSELVHRDPHTLRTGLLGAGSTTPQVVPVAAGLGSPFDPKIKRSGLGVAWSQVLSPVLLFDVSLHSEQRQGARLFGRGVSCPSTLAPGCLPGTGAAIGWAVLALPEPIDARHTQLQARLSYAGEKLRLSIGYHGSLYDNAHGTLNPQVPDSLNNALGSLLPLNTGLQALLNQPLALPPDNQAHHFDLSGHYAFSRSARLNFKLGHSRATQDEDFASAGLSGAPAGVTHLGGRVDTTFAQLSLHAKPLPALSLLAELRWRDRDDRTPLAAYALESGNHYTNRRLDNTNTRARLQASYQFSLDYRGTLQAQYESIDRGVFTPSSAVAGLSALRQKTDETGLRLELRRRMAEDFSAALSLQSSERGGSNWLKDNSGLGVTEVSDPSDASVNFSTAIFMPTLADRRRDKAQFVADWQPTVELSLQFSAQGGRDRYTAPSAYGLQRTRMESFSLDADFAVSEAWRVNGHVSRSQQRLHQSRPGATLVSMDNTSTTVGLGLTGKPAAKLEVGANLSHADDSNRLAQTLDASADANDAALLAASGGLPDLIFRQTTLRLYGRYAIDKHASVQLDLVHQRSKWTDWAWEHNGVPFVYADGSTLVRNPVQNASFVGVSFVYRWAGN